MASSALPNHRKLEADARGVIAAQFATAERPMNGVRIAMIGLLAVAAAFYYPHITLQLNAVNAAIIVPMLLWAIWQHFAVHRAERGGRTLSLANSVLDISAISALLLGYSLFGDATVAVRSPMFVMYFVILAARPFTGSAKRAAFSAALATVQYSALVAFLTFSGRLKLLESSGTLGPTLGTSLLDELSKILILVMAGFVVTYSADWIDRTLRRAVMARRNADARFRAVFTQSGVGVALLDRDAAILEANDGFATLLGTSVPDLLGLNVHDFSPTDDAETTQTVVRELLQGDRTTAAMEVRYVRQGGDIAWGSLTLTRADGASDVRLIAVVQDVTQRKSLEKELLRQAFYDQLTGLANRSLFRDRVSHAVARSARERDQIAVLFLDLDNFKSVNDTLGHAAGDALLEVVGSRLLNATRGCDTVARLGGDEFAVLLEGVRWDEDCSIVAERIVQALSEPVPLPTGHQVRVGASIGIARASGDDGVEELLRNADVAMYAAKGGTPGGYVFFDRAMHVALVDRVRLEADLRQAIENESLWLAYQPIVRLESKEVLGVEALVRWTHPVKGNIPPVEFIPLAEETGLIHSLGRFVLREACLRTARWNARRRDARRLSVTVNLSIRQLESPGLVEDVASALRDSGLEAQLLVLEITENAIMQRAEETLSRLRDLKALGVRLAIDDFGTGYSSLAYLQQFPVDILKIDRSFTEGLMRGSTD
ncbi:MAG: EAL domain-containing protein, partial [Gemmatimonadaceae bacterium]